MPFIFFVTLLGLGWLWIATAVQSHRLLQAFKERMPAKASTVLPEAFVAGRHPKKVWFFFTNEASRVLADDSQLDMMRKSFVRMCVASAALPFAVFAIAMIIILLSAPK